MLEFCHTIRGPTCGLVLGDFGADVIKVEPVEGDRTRRHFWGDRHTGSNRRGHRAGKGEVAKSALFESSAFLVSQHMVTEIAAGAPLAADAGASERVGHLRDVSDRRR